MKHLKNPKMQLLILLGALAVTGLAGARQWQDNLALFAVSFSAALIAQWAFFGAAPAGSVMSAAISGSIVGLLVGPGHMLFAWSAAVMAIASKKLLQFGERAHIFNPAAFGLAAALLIFGNRITWWGNTSQALIIIGAGAILFRMNRLTLPLAYFATRALTAALFGGIGFTRAALIMPNIFFAFIMLVEPKTSPGRPAGQLLFGGGAGILATVFYRFIPVYEGDIMALLAFNLARPWLTIITARRKASEKKS